MRANWVEMSATQAAANTNPTQLAAIANLPTWSDWFGTTGTKQVEYELDDGAGHYECGVGTINLATLSLSRDVVIATYDSGATPKASGANAARLTTFSAAATVRCAPTANAAPGGETLFLTSSAGSGGYVGNGYALIRADVGETTGLQGWRNFIPFLWTGTRPMGSCRINVTTAGTAGTLQVGIMEINGSNLTMIREFTATTAFDLTVSGFQTISNFAALYLPQGTYILQLNPANQAGGPKVSAASSYLNARCGALPRRSDARANTSFLDAAGATTLAQTFSSASNYGGGGSTAIYLPDITFGMI